MWEKVSLTLVSKDVFAKTQTGQPITGNTGELSFIKTENFSSEDPVKKSKSSHRLRASIC